MEVLNTLTIAIITYIPKLQKVIQGIHTQLVTISLWNNFYSFYTANNTWKGETYFLHLGSVGEFLSHAFSDAFSTNTKFKSHVCPFSLPIRIHLFARTVLAITSTSFSNNFKFLLSDVWFQYITFVKVVLASTMTDQIFLPAIIHVDCSNNSLCSCVLYTDWFSNSSCNCVLHADWSYIYISQRWLDQRFSLLLCQLCVLVKNRNIDALSFPAMTPRQSL